MNKMIISWIITNLCSLLYISLSCYFALSYREDAFTPHDDISTTTHYTTNSSSTPTSESPDIRIREENDDDDDGDDEDEGDYEEIPEYDSSVDVGISKEEPEELPEIPVKSPVKVTADEKETVDEGKKPFPNYEMIRELDEERRRQELQDEEPVDDPAWIDNKPELSKSELSKPEKNKSEKRRQQQISKKEQISKPERISKHEQISKQISKQELISKQEQISKQISKPEQINKQEISKPEQQQQPELIKQPEQQPESKQGSKPGKSFKVIFLPNGSRGEFATKLGKVEKTDAKQKVKKEKVKGLETCVWWDHMKPFYSFTGSLIGDEELGKVKYRSHYE